MKLFPLIGAGALTIAAVAAFAAPGAMGPGKADTNGDGAVSKAEMLAKADEHFAKMDVNKDGTLNATDKEAKVKAHFAEMDTDNNGSINEAEFVAAHQKRMEMRSGPDGAGREGMGPEGMGRGGKGMGHHGRGHKGRGGDHMAMMAKADSNGDKAISQAEFRAAAEARFAKADANNDGKISTEEHQAARKAMKGKWRDAAPPPSPAG
ncbi:MAG: EF-hand domain-containing protein [Sphingomonadales bacterium]|nr:EF-hand domain-containing protein [Sphingomonadales bacterium]